MMNGTMNIYHIFLAVAMPVLLSGEINTFLGITLGMNAQESAIMITPIAIVTTTL